jgi:hypothetical protein
LTQFGTTPLDPLLLTMGVVGRMQPAGPMPVRRSVQLVPDPR